VKPDREGQARSGTSYIPNNSNKLSMTTTNSRQAGGTIQTGPIPTESSDSGDGEQFKGAETPDSTDTAETDVRDKHGEQTQAIMAESAAHGNGSLLQAASAALASGPNDQSLSSSADGGLNLEQSANITSATAWLDPPPGGVGSDTERPGNSQVTVTDTLTGGSELTTAYVSRSMYGAKAPDTLKRRTRGPERTSGSEAVVVDMCMLMSASELL